MAELKYTAADRVDHPSHYHKGTYEAINVIEAWDLEFCLGNAVKYISRAGSKDPAKEIEDLEKASWYLSRRVEFLKKQKLEEASAMMETYKVHPAGPDGSFTTERKFVITPTGTLPEHQHLGWPVRDE